MLRLALFALHRADALQETRAGGYVLGAAMAACAKIATAACLGEARYKDKTIAMGIGKQGLDSRNAVYTRAFTNLDDALSRLPAAHELFRKPIWGGGSIGGPKWADCTAWTLRLVKAVTQLSKYAVADHVNKSGLPSLHAAPYRVMVEALDAFNGIINAAHNCGPFLNKFGPHTWINEAAAGDLKWTLDTMLPLWRTLEARKAAPGTWPKTLLKPPKPLPLPPPPKLAVVQVRWLELPKSSTGSVTVHLQYKIEGHDGYESTNVALPTKDAALLMRHPMDGTSFAGSNAKYLTLEIDTKAGEIKKGAVVVCKTQTLLASVG